MREDQCSLLENNTTLTRRTGYTITLDYKL